MTSKSETDSWRPPASEQKTKNVEGGRRHSPRQDAEGNVPVLRGDCRSQIKRTQGSGKSDGQHGQPCHITRKVLDSKSSENFPLASRHKKRQKRTRPGELPAGARGQAIPGRLGFLWKRVHEPGKGPPRTWGRRSDKASHIQLQKMHPRGSLLRKHYLEMSSTQRKVLRVPISASMATSRVIIIPWQDKQADKNAGRKSLGGRRNLRVPRHPKLPPAPQASGSHARQPHLPVITTPAILHSFPNSLKERGKSECVSICEISRPVYEDSGTRLFYESITQNLPEPGHSYLYYLSCSSVYR